MRKRIIYFVIALVVFACEATNSKSRMVTSSTVKNNELSIEHFSNQTTKVINPTVNVYIENSASMNGYVNGATQFKESIYSFLSDIKNVDFSDTIKLFYINNTIIRQNTNLHDFIYNLNPNNLSIGQTSTTDISGILRQILSRTNNRCISIFISDCIFSPGPNQNASAYLNLQQTDIKNYFSDNFNKHSNLGVVIFRLNSIFNGLYYNVLNQRTRINSNRPYFIWVVGETELLKEFTNKIKKDNVMGGGISNVYMISGKNKKINYGILLSPVIGSFQIINKTTIEKVRKDKQRGEFLFSVGVEFSKLLLEENYLRNPMNYSCSDPNYTLEVIKANTGNYSHIIKLKTKANILSATNIKIRLINNLPPWINDFNDSDGININTPGAMLKTYGIKNLIQGVYDAYTTSEDSFAEINVSIK